MNRRRVLPLLLAVAGAVTHASVAADADSANAAKNFVSGKYRIDIAGQSAGYVAKYGGGMPYAAVVTEGVTGGYLKKHLSNLGYEDIAVSAGLGMGNSLYDWIKATVNSPSSHGRKDGAIVFADYSGNEQARLNWFQGFVSGVTFPACDGESKDPSEMQVTIAPQVTRRVKPQGASSNIGSKSTQKKWLASNFRLQIDGVDSAALTHVMRIEPISVRFKEATNPVGEARDYEKSPGAVDVSNLEVTVAEGSADSMLAWLDDFLVKGNNADAKERNGTLQYLADDLSTVLFTLSFGHLGLFRADAAEASTSNQNPPPQVHHVRRVDFLRLRGRGSLTRARSSTTRRSPRRGQGSSPAARSSSGRARSSRTGGRSKRRAARSFLRRA